MKTLYNESEGTKRFRNRGFKKNKIFVRNYVDNKINIFDIDNNGR
jgi:hypothetical protein